MLTFESSVPSGPSAGLPELALANVKARQHLLQARRAEITGDPRAVQEFGSALHELDVAEVGAPFSEPTRAAALAGLARLNGDAESRRGAAGAFRGHPARRARRS